MAKALKTAVLVIGAVALVATGVGAVIGGAAFLATFGVSLATISAISAVAGVAGMALNYMFPVKPKGSSLSGSQTTFRLDPAAGIPYVMGRTLCGGFAIHRDTWGTDNQYQGFNIVWSGCGPIDAFEQFQVDQVGNEFDPGTGAAIGSRFANFMWLKSQRGDCPSPALQSPVAGFPGWTPAKKLSGYAASSWVVKFDSKGKKFTGGLPKPGMVLRGVKVYDPRQDSTYPGGVGPCRPGNEATYVYSENPWLHALTWALGRWQNGVKIMGVGMALAAISVPSFVDAANVADANGWRLGGAISSTDDKWEAMKMMAQAGGGQVMRLGAKLTALADAPRVSIATIRTADLVGKARVATAQLNRNRLNGVVPVWRSEAHGWEMVPGSPVRFEEYVAEDGRRKTEETAFPLVQDPDQAAELAAYEILNSREFGPIDLQLSIKWLGLEPGDLVTLDIPEARLFNQPALALTRGIELGTGAVILSLRSETLAKHDLALGRTTTVPASPGLAPRDIESPLAPAGAEWALTSEGFVGADGSSIPALVLNGAVGNLNATAMIIEYRPAGVGAAWASAGRFAPTTTRVEIPGVTSGTSYEVAVSYEVFGVVTPRLVKGPLVATDLVAGGFSGEGALFRPAANILYNGGGLLRLDGWDNASGNWGWAAGAGEGQYFYSFTSNALIISRPIRVYASEVYALAAEIDAHLTAGNVVLDVQWYSDLYGLNLLEDGGGPISGLESNWERITTPVMSPPGAQTARIRIFTEGAALRPGTSVAVRRVKFSRGAEVYPFSDEATDSAMYGNGQTVDSLRPAEAGADPTGGHQAASIAGQTDWATYDVGVLPPARVVGRIQRIQDDGYIESAGVFRAGSDYLSNRWPAEAGADPTGGHQAASIAGQTDWATYDVGVLPPARVVGRIQRIQDDGHIESAGVFRAGSDYLSNRWPAEAGADPTGGHQAASIAGQTDWATDSRPPAALFGGRANILRNGGFRLLNQAWTLGAWGVTNTGGNEGPYVVSQIAGTNVMTSDQLGFYAGASYSLQGELLLSGAAGNVAVDIEFDNGTYSPRLQAVRGVGWHRLRVPFAAGSGSGHVRIFTEGAAAGIVAAVRRVKISADDLDVPFTDELTDGAQAGRLQGRAPRAASFMPASWSAGLTTITSTFPVSDSDNGGSNCTINIAAFSKTLDDGSVVNYPSGSFVGKPYGTKYYIWRNDPDLTGGSSYDLSTDISDARGVGKVYLGAWTTRASAGSVGGGVPPRPGDCVASSSFVLVEDPGERRCEVVGDEHWIRAGIVRPGDRVRTLEAGNVLGWRLVTHNHLALEPAVAIVLPNGHQLSLSESTPITLEDGSSVLAKHVDRRAVGSLRDGEVEWLACSAVPIGEIEVAHISCGNGTYLAGDRPGEGVFSHNVYK